MNPYARTGELMADHWTSYKSLLNSDLKLSRATSAAITVDMQRDFLDPAIGSSPLPADTARTVVDATVEFLAFARSQGIPVIHAYVQRRQVEVDRGVTTGLVPEASARLSHPQNTLASTAVAADRLIGSPQADLVAGIADRGDIHMTTKKTLDSFLWTDLDYILSKVLAVDTVFLAGVNTDSCVYATALSAANRRYRTVLVSDCLASMRGEDSHRMALEMASRTFAWVLTADEVRAKLGGPATRRATERSGAR